MNSEKPIPAPHELLAKAKGIQRPKKLDLSDYVETMRELRNKDMSYADVAQWFSENLGMEVQRGQIYRIYNNWLQLLEHIKQEEAEAAEAALCDGEDVPESPDDDDHGEPPEETHPLRFASIEEARVFVANWDENMAEREDKIQKESKDKK